jgi:hypothetical protein
VDVWKQFEECLDTQKQTPILQCKHCQKYIAHPLAIGKGGKAESVKKSSSGTTTSLTRHLGICGRYQRSIGKEKTGSVTEYFQSSHSQRETTNRLTKYDVLDKVLNFFISGNIAFNQADNPWFQELIALITVNDNPVIVNRDNITKRLHDHANVAREDLMTRLMTNDSKINLALDCWTSDNNIAFLGNALL